MKGTLKGLAVTIKTAIKKPVTVQYPQEHLPLAPRYAGVPLLLWDEKTGEPACTGCQVCMRYCPTECITVSMMDNPKFKAGESKRKKIVQDFQIRMERCILCQICVEVCNFNAIRMSDLHEEADHGRGDLVMTKAKLLEQGKEYMQRAGIVVGDEAEEEA
jgi:NADH-quinone oxidoreductase subunit I